MSRGDLCHKLAVEISLRVNCSLRLSYQTKTEQKSCVNGAIHRLNHLDPIGKPLYSFECRFSKQQNNTQRYMATVLSQIRNLGLCQLESQQDYIDLFWNRMACAFWTRKWLTDIHGIGLLSHLYSKKRCTPIF